jgi:hypothetical protein
MSIFKPLVFDELSAAVNSATVIAMGMALARMKTPLARTSGSGNLPHQPCRKAFPRLGQDAPLPGEP